MGPPKPSNPPRKTANHRWPPVASIQGVDLPIAALFGILVGLFAVMWFSWSAFAGPPGFVIGWQYEPNPSAVVRQLIAPNVVELVLWLLVLTLLGWRRAVGLVAGSASLWGIVPLGMFWAATLLAAGLSDVVSKGAATVLLAAVGFFVAAMTEEIAYRGFLLHGLTRRFGGTAAVLLSSGTFALMHIPTLLEQREPYIIGTLLGLFGSGVIYCRIRVATGSVWFPTAVHALKNLTYTGIVVWGYPEGQAPMAYDWFLRAYSTAGFILAIGLVLRWYFPRAMGRLVSTASRDRDRGPPQDWWVVQVGPFAFERFTDAARRVIVQAEQEARVEQARSIATEHVLLGVIHQSDGVAARALEASGFSVGPADRLEELIGGRSWPAPSSLSFDPRTKLVLQLAIRETDERERNHVGAEHILLALTGVRSGEAFRAFRTSGVDPGQLRRTLLRLMTEATWTETAAQEDVDLPPVDRPAQPPDRPARQASDPFPDSIRRILDTADRRAMSMGSTVVGTEHLLFALLCEQDGVVAASLEATGLCPTSGPRVATPDDVRGRPSKTLPLTPRAKRVIEAAIMQVDEMAAPRAGSQLLLLALIDDRRGEAARTLASRGVNLDRLRSVVSELSESEVLPDEETAVESRSPRPG